MHTPPTVLLVEDNEDDIFFMQRAWKSADMPVPLQLARDGQEAVDYLAGTGPFSDRERHPSPSIVLLDLKLPFKNGHEVIEWIRANPLTRRCVVVVLTSSKETSDIRRAYEAGANAYLVKPAAGPDLVEVMRAFRQFWLRFNLTP